MLGRNAFLGLAAQGVEIADILRYSSAVRTLAVNQSQSNGRFIQILEAYQISGFSASVVVEDQIIFIADKLIGAVLNRRLIALLMHGFLVQLNISPVPSFESAPVVEASVEIGRDVIAVI